MSASALRLIDDDEAGMRQALLLAEEAAQQGEVPVGAVVVYEGKVIGRGYNRREQDKDPLAHAELIAIKEASAFLGAWRLIGCTLYVTLEPCAMCAGALINSRVGTVVYGARDPKAGAVTSLFKLCNDSRLNHRLNVKEGVLAADSTGLLKKFFAKLRNPD